MSKQPRPGTPGDWKDWKDIEAEASRDLEAITTDLNAYNFMERYFSKELQGQYIAIYRSLRNEMLKTPRQAIDTILSLPPL
jgi:hypothetical protein